MTTLLDDRGTVTCTAEGGGWLTLRRREGVRRQKITEQLAREAKRSVELKKIPVGGGVR